jgi:hypothetical protein
VSLRRIWNALTLFWRAALRHVGLASLLLLMVAITHIGYSGIASLYDEPVRAAKAWHSVLRAFPESTLLYLMVWNMTPWEPISRRLGVSVACFLGACASFQIAMCRVQFPMDKPPPDVELYQGMCDKATGLPIYMLILGVILVLVFTFLVRRIVNKKE